MVHSFKCNHEVHEVTKKKSKLKVVFFVSSWLHFR